MNVLSPLQVRVLACLMEKRETTPEQYPLSLNALRLACNQKTAREPVTNYTEGEVGHAIRELEGLGWLREVWGARVPRYEHLAEKALGVQSKGLALLCVLMLRGPQTLGELRTNAQRLFAFQDLDDIQYVLQRLAEHEPPLARIQPRQPGQKESRYVHLLAGEPAPERVERSGRPAPAADVVVPAAGDLSALRARIEALEEDVRALRGDLEALRNR